MDDTEIIIRLRAGLACGREKTCGTKAMLIDHSAAKTRALMMSQKLGKPMDAYPCIFCGYWHIGNKISLEVLQDLADKLDNMI